MGLQRAGEVVQKVLAQHVAGGEVHGDGLKAGRLDLLAERDLELVVLALTVRAGALREDLVVRLPGVEQRLVLEGRLGGFLAQDTVGELAPVPGRVIGEALLFRQVRDDAADQEHLWMRGTHARPEADVGVECLDHRRLDAFDSVQHIIASAVDVEAVFVVHEGLLEWCET